METIFAHPIATTIFLIIIFVGLESLIHAIRGTRVGDHDNDYY